MRVRGNLIPNNKEMVAGGEISRGGERKGRSFGPSNTVWAAICLEVKKRSLRVKGRPIKGGSLKLALREKVGLNKKKKKPPTPKKRGREVDGRQYYSGGQAASVCTSSRVGPGAGYHPS